MKITIRDNNVYIDDNNNRTEPDFVLEASEAWGIRPTDTSPRYNAFHNDYFNFESEAHSYLASCYSEKDTKMSYEEWTKDLMIDVVDRPENKLVIFFENHPTRTFRYSDKERLVILNDITGIEAG